MENKEKRLITAALPYVNNVPHLGHIVGSHLPADIFARYSRLKGHETLFIGGTDEHGTPSVLAAEKMGVTPQQLCDYFHRIHKGIYEWFNFSYDNFSRTTRPIHHQTTQDFFKKVYEKGWIIEKEMLLPFCEECERFLPDRYIEGVCPFCGYKSARGDQCEKCGRMLDPVELKDARCAICDSKKIEFKKTKHLFLDLRGLSDNIEDWVRENKHWREQVRQLALGWIKEGLKPRSITRDLDWGVQVPLEGYASKVFYVWFDAPIGYISSTKEKIGEKWKKYWENPESKIYHFVGKDNIPFHTIFWPGALIAHGDLNLPYNVIGLQYLNYEGRKISKSKKWGVFCENFPEAGLEPDYWRFYLSFLIPETADTDFKWEEFKDRVNQELIGNFSNFVHRTLSMIDKYFGGTIKEADLQELSAQDKGLIETIQESHEKITGLIEEAELRRALREIVALASEGNKYFDHQAPWKQVKEDKKKAGKTLLLCLNLANSLSVLVSPYLPLTSERIRGQIGVEKLASGNVWDSAKEFSIKPPHQIGKPEILFEKLTEEKIEELKEKTGKLKKPEILK